MSDYGGIIGGVVGAVVGFFAGGNVYAGWMIGSAIGGAWSTSQQVHQGPKIGEIAQQSAQEGGPRPIVFGRSAPMPGNIIADGKPRIVVKRERQGKGGPKVETESAYRTYAVGVCEGPATLLQAWRNGTLVYDAESPGWAAENAKFLEYARWFTGSFDQMPSPDLEAIYGAGNVSAHRGTAYCVLANEDVTDQRGAWSQWVFRVFRGAARSYTTPPYPVHVVDSIGGSSRAVNGVIWQSPLDEMSVTSSALDGAHRDLISMFGYSEDIEVASVALNGVHRPLIAGYLTQNEDIGVNSNALNGVKKIVLIEYLNYQSEHISVSSHALNGTRGPT